MAKQFREAVRFAPPLSQAQIPRPNLLRRAALGVDRRLLLVTGPAGYGKTSLLSSLTLSQRERTRSAWCSMRPEQANPQSFLTSLSQAIRAVGGDSQRQSWRSRRSRTSEEILDSLCEELRSWREGHLLLVLDNYEKIRASEPANAILQQLIWGASDAVCFAIASREAPGFPIARLRVSQELLEIAQQDLAFSEEETRELMAQELGFHLAPEDLAIVQRACQGWLAGLVMVAESMRSSSPERVLEILRTHERPPQHIYDYFAEEVLLSQPPDMQEFLLKTSILEILDPEACDHVVDDADHGRRLDDLRRQGVFLSVSEPLSGGLRYHDLFRSFLSARLRERVDLPGYHELHRLAALVYEERGQCDLAIRHYSQAGQPEAIARIIRRVGPELADRGLLDTIQAWLSHLPKEWLGECPELHVVLGTALWRGGNRITALAHLEEAHRLSRARGSASGVAAALYQIARSDLVQGQPGHAAAAFQEAIDLLGPGEPQGIDAQAIQGLAQFRAGATSLAQETTGRAIVLARGIAAPETRAELLVRALRLASLLDLQLGDLDLAVSRLRESLAVGGDRPALANDLRWNKYVLAVTLLRQGELQAAAAVFGEAGWETADLPGLRREWASRWVGDYWYEHGDYARAEAAYQLAERFGLKGIAFLRTQTGHRAEGLRLAQRNWHLVERGSDVVARADAQAVLGIVHQSVGQAGAAIEWLQQAVAGYERMGLQQRLASAQLWLAHLAAGEGDSKRADGWLASALDLARQRGYYYFFWWSAPPIAWACARGFHLKLERDYLCELIRRRLDVAEARSLLALGAGGNLDWRGTIAQILRLLADRMPNMGPIHEDLLTRCGDDVARRQLMQAVSRRELSPWGLKLLRQGFELSWREIEVFHAYFLAPLFAANGGSSHHREQAAERLQMTPNTLGTHLQRIRRKLDLPERCGALYILRWAIERGIVEWSTSEDPL